LQPKLRTFFGDFECPVDHHFSKAHKVYCTTPEVTYLDVANRPLTVTGWACASRVPDDDSAFATFTFSDDATPTVAAVSPAVAGPGEDLKIHAWTCDEDKDACRLIVLIPAVGMDTNYTVKPMMTPAPLWQCL